MFPPLPLPPLSDEFPPFEGLVLPPPLEPPPEYPPPVVPPPALPPAALLLPSVTALPCGVESLFTSILAAPCAVSSSSISRFSLE